MDTWANILQLFVFKPIFAISYIMNYFQLNWQGVNNEYESIFITYYRLSALLNANIIYLKKMRTCNSMTLETKHLYSVV